QNLRMLPEERRQLLEALRPFGHGQGERRRTAKPSQWLGPREIRRGVLFLHLDGAIGLDADQALGGLAVFAVGQIPKGRRNGIPVVIEAERERSGSTAHTWTSDAVIVVKLIVADAHRDIQQPRANFIVAREQPEG